MARQPHYGRVSPVSAGIRGACPRCGRGKLFSGFLKTAPGCRNCGLDYDFMDGGDGPAVFVILLGGFVVVAAALVVEVMYQPPFWVHAILWLPLGILLPLSLLRPLKGIFVCLQYHNKAEEGRLEQ